MSGREDFPSYVFGAAGICQVFLLVVVWLTPLVWRLPFLYRTKFETDSGSDLELSLGDFDVVRRGPSGHRRESGDDFYPRLAITRKTIYRNSFRPLILILVQEDGDQGTVVEARFVPLVLVSPVMAFGTMIWLSRSELDLMLAVSAFTAAWIGCHVYFFRRDVRYLKKCLKASPPDRT